MRLPAHLEGRTRRYGAREYLMGLGVAGEYEQDEWPETDALLEVVARARGRVLDVGTGCGILAIEAAARGCQVVATDLHQSTLALARLNAQLNHVSGIDFRCGHIYEPVAGERFDVILAAPHVVRTSYQLRWEILLGATEHLTPTGRLVMGAALEWEGDGPLAIEPLLRRLGRASRVARIHSHKLRHWHRAAVAEEPVARLISRGRFTVELSARAGAVEVEKPAPGDDAVPVVPLARLRQVGRVAALGGAEDVARLRALLALLEAPTVVFSEPLPLALLDACRLSPRACLSAAGAILDGEGAVRPCTHGGAVGRAEDTQAVIDSRLGQLAREAAARRGCDACPALGVCSQCLFPAALDEAGYCALMRDEVRRLPIWHRLLETVRLLDGAAPPLRVARWPRREWHAREETPSRLDALCDRWNAAAAWSVSAGGAHFVFALRDGELARLPLSAQEAAEAERAADGLPVDEGPWIDRLLEWLP